MNYYVLQLYHTWTINVLWIYCVLMYFQMRKYDQTVLKSPGIKTGKSFKSHLPNVFNQSSEGSKFAFPSSKSSTTVSFTISIVPVLSWILWVSQPYADVHICAPICKKRFQFVYSIFQVDFPVNYYLKTMNKRKYSTKVQLNNRIIASQVTVNTMSLPIIHSVVIDKLRIVLMTLEVLFLLSRVPWPPWEGMELTILLQDGVIRQE